VRIKVTVNGKDVVTVQPRTTEASVTIWPA
jgi:hypothetical protein